MDGSVTVSQYVIIMAKRGVTCLDGGAMFGVVPKPLWSRKYPVNEKIKLNYQQNLSLFNMRAKLPH